MQDSPAIHHTIVAVDIADFTNPVRTDLHHKAMTNGLYKVLETAFDDAGVKWTDCHNEDRGDGVLILVPPAFPKTLIVDQLPNRLVAGLYRHNAVHAEEALIQLRMAVHSGEVSRSAMGSRGHALNNTFRFLDAEAAKAGLRESGGVLAMIVSDTVYQEVIVTDAGTKPDDFTQIPVNRIRSSAWLRILGTVGDQSRVLEAFSEQAIGELRRLLGEVSVPELSLLLAETTGHGVQPLRQPAGVWEAVRYLQDLNTEPGGFPRLLTFVELLSGRVPADLAGRLREWNDVQARDLRQQDALGRLRAKQAARTETRHCLHLMIRIEHDMLDANLYTISHWRQDDPYEWPPARGEILQAPFSDLEHVVDELVIDAEIAWSEHRGDVALEFVLPRVLLSLPVHEWFRELQSGDPRPLVLDYPIVVRSLERMMARHWRRVWETKWRALVEDSSSARVYIAGEPDFDHPYRIDLGLKDAQVVSMVLTSSPADEVKPHDELSAALRAGLPAVLWSRREGDAQAVYELVTRLGQSCAFQDLPRRVHEARLAVLAGADQTLPSAVIQNLVILWDNPRRSVYLEQPPRPARLEGDTADERERAS